ncbi:MAG TPA: M1 family aminopeptidase [bacterium]|nr:M1 family aminopeptidase [bacterium]
MSAKRFFEIFRQEVLRIVTSPSFFIFIAVLILMSYGLTSGNVRLSSGSSDIGGTKTCITSEFSIAFVISILSFILYSFFVTVPAGMTLIRDREHKIEEILHTTALTPGEYILGKYMAVLAVFSSAMFLQCGMFIVIHHLIPDTATADVIGPFRIGNYFRPFILFCLPAIVFFSGIAFFIGARTRRPALVYLFPTVILIVDVLFFVNWSPEWLPEFWNNVLILLDQSGFRWLDETWLKVDRGAEFYNTQPISYNILFFMNRLVTLAAGVIPVGLAYVSYLRTLRKRDSVRQRGKASVQSMPSRGTVTAESEISAGTRSTPGFFTALLNVIRSEFQELRHHGGLYLFIPIFALMVLGDVFTAVGLFDTPMLVTAGTIASKTLQPLTILGVLFLMFYVVESFMREEVTGIAPMLHSAPVSTYAILIGKMIAVLGVGLIIMAASFAGALAGLIIQGSVPVNPVPFALLWGIVLIPTYFVWIAFITLLFSVTRNRYVTYALGLGLFMLFGVLQVLGKINWVSNWVLWRTIHWSDISVLEIDRGAIFLNRLFYLAVALLCIMLAKRLYSRTRRDAAQSMFRLQPARLLRSQVFLLPFVLVPLILGWILYADVRTGHGGSVSEKAQKDYWRQNVRTYLDYPEPGLRHVDLDVIIHPDQGTLEVTGRYDLVNPHETMLQKLIFTGDYGWEDITWSMNGAPVEPEDRSGLFVFTPDSPLEPDDGILLSFSFKNRIPVGISKNGQPASEFVLPSGVVLTSFTPSFAPLPGFVEEVGLTKDNRPDAREYAPDFYQGRTLPFVGAANAFTTHIEITVPSYMRANSVGVLTSVIDHEDTRTWIWDSDYPIRFYNIVAGEYAKREGSEGTAVYYHPEHAYNVDKILQALDGARTYYSQWYAPYPWKELRITEFPGIAYYAQGFPSNISFSEQVGFLVKDEKDGNAAFTVAAHESAHQWWANILTPGKGPGGNVLSEGMAHFSTAMLIDAELGQAAREAFLKRIEDSYGDKRMVDNERSLAWVDGSRPGDDTIMYDKGGWVFWMLRDLMGHDALMSGLRAFIETYRFGPDYPVIQDFTVFMRAYAPDPHAYDAFVDQWFYDVVMPEYHLNGVTLNRGSPSLEIGDTQNEDTWIVTGELQNSGTGNMTVRVCACAGDRYPDSSDGSGDETTGTPPYQRASVDVSPGPDASVSFTIECGFKPDRVVVDPDVMVLQLNRKRAVSDNL